VKISTKQSPFSRVITNRTISEKFRAVRNHSEIQCEPLSAEDYVPQPVAFISPPKWHLAHTSWFFEEFILKNHYAGYKIFDTDFSFLFNSYYNLVGDRVLRAERGNLTRPGVDKMYDYRKYVDEHMLKLLEINPSSELIDLVVLGLNHEQQHQELLLTDLKYIFGHNPTFPVYKENYSLVNHQNTESGYALVQSGNHEIGFRGNGFCYDNELGRHTVYLHQYEISKALVTNGEFMEFMESGAYNQSDYWLDEGWTWKNENKIVAPMYWHKIEGVWHHYTLAGLKPVNPDHILCHVNYYEAAAFAEWAQMRLPTEFEWEVASELFDWGICWEWTGSAYLPYPGYKKPAGAVGEYNGKFMINQMVLRGASAASSSKHSRNTYRNFFHPHHRWQCTGVRLAKKHII
jgi:ergothioneine biosynthesis protein EgtB